MIHLESVDSTNNYAAKLLASGTLESGTVILADEQYAGRGQRGAEWVAQPGMNLILSFFVNEVNLAVDQQFFLSKMVAVGIQRFLRKYDVHAKIKWPNDMYVNNLKIGGVLVENQLKGNHVHSSIIGIGLNINQVEFGHLPATSLKLETGRSFPLRELRLSFIHSMNSAFEAFWTRREALDSAYLSELYRFKIPGTYKDKDGLFTGTIVDVMSSGHLCVERDGKGQLYDLKEIRFIPD